MSLASERAQGVISSLDSGLGLILLRIVLYGCLAAAVMGGYAATQFYGLRSAEAMEISHVARSLSTGQGFTTRCIHPFDAWYLRQRTPDVDLARIPDLHHPPAYPLLLSTLYRLVRPDFSVVAGRGGCDAEYKVLLPAAVILTLLSALVVFGLGSRLFGSRVAGLATVLYLVSNLTLKAVVSGLPLPLLTLAVTLACGLAIRAVQLSTTDEQRLKMLLMVLGSAVCTAVAMLTDYTMIAICAGIVALLAVQLQRLRWVSMILFLVVCGGLVAPWLLHNHQRDIGLLGATPYTAVSDSMLFPGDALERAVAPEFNSYRVAAAVRQKLLGSVAEDLTGGGVLAGGVILCFFLVALCHRYENPVVTGLKWFVLGVSGMLLLLHPLVGPSYVVLGALYPLAVLLGVSAFVDYLGREEFFEESWPLLLTGVMIVMCALPAVAQVVGIRPEVYPPYYAPIQKYVCELVEDGEFLYTDIPWATAWYGDRSSVLLPQQVADVEALSDGWDRIGGVYLTTETGDKPVGDGGGWRPLLHQQVPESVPLRHAIRFPRAGAGQLFLSDRPRWKSPE
jgi:4-amino-4-deoxy-L-arabinose transferase-like glycosyltransferase